MSIAAATPGYCTLTATSVPSRSFARCTWPIDAAAIGSSSKLLEVLAEIAAEVLLDHAPRDRELIGGASI